MIWTCPRPEPSSGTVTYTVPSEPTVEVMETLPLLWRSLAAFRRRPRNQTMATAAGDADGDAEPGVPFGAAEGAEAGPAEAHGEGGDGLDGEELEGVGGLAVVDVAHVPVPFEGAVVGEIEAGVPDEHEEHADEEDRRADERGHREPGRVIREEEIEHGVPLRLVRRERVPTARADSPLYSDFGALSFGGLTRLEHNVRL